MPIFTLTCAMADSLSWSGSRQMRPILLLLCLHSLVSADTADVMSSPSCLGRHWLWWGKYPLTGPLHLCSSCPAATAFTAAQLLGNKVWLRLMIIRQCPQLRYFSNVTTGCPISLGPLSFCHFLGFWSTYRGTIHRIAHKIFIPKLTLLSILR